MLTHHLPEVTAGIILHLNTITATSIRSLLPHFKLRTHREMDDFTNLLIQHFFFEELLLGNPWANAKEKSSAAECRERTAVKKFDYLRSQMNMALIENTRVIVGLGCHPKSESSFNLLTPELVRHILGFVGMEKPADADVGNGRMGLAIVPCEGWRACSRSTKMEETDIDIDLADMNLYKSGKKIIIPFTTPKHHLTAPCYRDLRKHIKAHAGWDIQRIAATPQQKRAYDEHRRGRVYFTNAIYKVLGKPPTRKRRRKTGFLSEPLSPTQQAKATSVLVAAVQSAGIDGQVDHVCLQRATNVGYSKCFVLCKVAEYCVLTGKDIKHKAKKKKVKTQG